MEFEKKELSASLPEAGDVAVLKDRSEPAGEFNVKPWGFDEIEQLTPTFERIFSDLKRRKLSLRDFYQTTKLPEDKERIDLLNFDQLYFVIMPHLREIFKISMRISDSDVSRIRPDDMATMLLKIVMQNIGYLKNWLALAAMLTARTIV
jgi:hypothetical protein